MWYAVNTANMIPCPHSISVSANSRDPRGRGNMALYLFFVRFPLGTNRFLLSVRFFENRFSDTAKHRVDFHVRHSQVFQQVLGKQTWVAVSIGFNQWLRNDVPCTDIYGKHRRKPQPCMYILIESCLPTVAVATIVVLRACKNRNGATQSFHLRRIESAGYWLSPGL